MILKKFTVYVPQTPVPPALGLVPPRLNTTVKLDELMEGTKGTGVSGSGGSPEARVEGIMLRNRGHLFCFEAVSYTAEHCAA